MPQLSAPGRLMSPAKAAAAVSYPFVYNAKRSNTVGLREAIYSAKNGVARKRVLFCGNSTVFGTGNSPGTGTFNALWSLTYVQQLKTLLTNGICPTKMNTIMGGAALSIANYKIYDVRLTGNAGWTLTNPATSHSIGGAMFQGATAGDQVNLSVPDAFDSAEILYLDPAATRSILVRANGATVATFSPTTTANTPKRAVVTGISPATTTLGHRPGSSAAVFIVGIGTYLASETAMTLYQAGWGGSVAANWDDTSLIYSAVSAIPVLAPEHTFIELTINDENAPTNLTTYKAQIQALIDAALLSGSVTIVVGGPTAPNPPEATHTPLATQMTFWQALYDLAVLNDISVLDMTIGMGSYASADANGWMFDVSHPNLTGYGIKAGLFYNYFQQVTALGA